MTCQHQHHCLAALGIIDLGISISICIRIGISISISSSICIGISISITAWQLWGYQNIDIVVALAS